MTDAERLDWLERHAMAQEVILMPSERGVELEFSYAGAAVHLRAPSVRAALDAAIKASEP